MKYENILYLTSDKLLDIEFLFVDLGYPTGWRAYILTDIDYKKFSYLRSDSSTVVHRLTENDSELNRLVSNYLFERGDMSGIRRPLRYICWNKAIHRLSDMKKVAKTWSEITAYYIRNGGTFETIQPKLRSRGVISL